MTKFNATRHAPEISNTHRSCFLATALPLSIALGQFSVQNIEEGVIRPTYYYRPYG